MPLYNVKCEQTGVMFERFIKLVDFGAPILCACGARASRVISTPMFTIDNTGYNCPVTGNWIGSKRQHEENLKHQGCRVLEKGETELATKNRENADLELDKKVENTVEKEIDSWSSAKKEQLHNELVNGKLDLTVERK